MLHYILINNQSFLYNSDEDIFLHYGHDFRIKS